MAVTEEQIAKLEMQADLLLAGLPSDAGRVHEATAASKKLARVMTRLARREPEQYGSRAAAAVRLHADNLATATRYFRSLDAFHQAVGFGRQASRALKKLAGQDQDYLFRQAQVLEDLSFAYLQLGKLSRADQANMGAAALFHQLAGRCVR